MKILKIFVLVIIAFAAGYIVSQMSAPEEKPVSGVSEVQQAGQQWWTCSMHPQIRQPRPGKCPLCFMDLIPIAVADAGEKHIEFSEETLKLMEVETAAVERRFVETQVRMVGKIEYDETRVKNIAAWAPGRIDKLYVDFTGTRVLKGDHMVYLYSPNLITAQAELLQAFEASRKISSESSDLIKRSIETTLAAAREKLRLLGLTSEQIQTVEKTGQIMDHLTIYAPIGGIVIEKNVKEGTYVETGQIIYTIADLSELWVKLDAYESDLVWLRYGQTVELAVEAWPGEIFKGTISFISPTMDPQTRTIKLRVNVSNPEGKLKPEMFVHATVRSKVAMSGMAMDPNMAGKYICPMHPDIVKDAAATCDICGMNLVTAESLGFTAAKPGEPPLVIPATAPLITGERAVVYVKVPDVNVPTFEGREITLGPRTDDFYIVKSGLKEGELVVTKGNFKIDAALQIQAKPSMMNPQGALQSMPPGHKH